MMTGTLLKHIVCYTILMHSVLGFPEMKHTWEAWKQAHMKVYNSVEQELEHLEIWRENYNIAYQHNNRADSTFKMEMNHLADVVFPGSKDHHTSREPQATQSHSNHILFSPDSWDWRTKGAISNVKNQGAMVDVEAIVATECVESYHVIQGGSLTALSVGEAHDCCTKPSITPSSGSIFECIHDIGGLCSQADYPTSAGSCRNNTCTAAAQVKGGSMVKHGDEAAMKDAVYKTPVMVLVDAGHVSFQLYRSGIYQDPKCSSKELDHALQVVGYGSAAGVDYWICKNSWGLSWGEQGYIRIARNKGNMCGIASRTTYPV